MAFQVANVKRPLLAVSTLTRTGNDVAFTAGGGVITNRRTGRTISFVRKGGVYVLEVMVAPPPSKTAAGPSGAVGSLAALGKSERPATATGQGATAGAPGQPGCAPGFGRPGTVA